ncbi:MAG: carboxypeptidase-like regulatory domain-containing protein [Spirosomataceae bacterium]
MRKLLQCSLLMAMCLFVLSVRAQDREVTGKVISSEDGSQMPGVSIAVKGTSKGTNSDAEGNYRLSVPENATLVFSFVGFALLEEKVNGRSVINVQLKAEARNLSEIVVTGYGSQIKRELTGNIAKIRPSDIQDMPVNTFDQAIQGKAAGVQVNAGSSKLGQAIQVRVRGNSSVSASNQPLYVLDGIPVTTQNLSNNGGATNPLADINPKILSLSKY